MKSKYVEIASIGYLDFSRSEVGAVAKYLLKPHPAARAEVSKFIKAACSRVKAICELKTELSNFQYSFISFVLALLAIIAGVFYLSQFREV